MTTYTCCNSAAENNPGSYQHVLMNTHRRMFMRTLETVQFYTAMQPLNHEHVRVIWKLQLRCGREFAHLGTVGYGLQASASIPSVRCSEL